MATKNTTIDDNKNLERDNQGFSGVQAENQAYDYITNQPMIHCQYKA